MYLEVLHARGKANSHHTTILLNCYTRLAAHDKIRGFIDHNFECNIETAVQVLFKVLETKFRKYLYRLYTLVLEVKTGNQIGEIFSTTTV